METTVKLEIIKTEEGLEHIEQTKEIETVTELAARLPDKVFAKYLTMFGKILLSKSQKPKDKKKKSKTAAKIGQLLRAETGISYTARQILKKLHNLKSKLKNKTDTCANEGCKLSLNPAEKELLNLIDDSGASSCNGGIVLPPNILKLSDVASVCPDNNTFEFVTSTRLLRAKKNSPASPHLLQNEKQIEYSVRTPSTSTPNSNELSNGLETSETEGLSLEQLERIALLKQLKILDMQERLLQKQLIAADLRLEGYSK